MHSSVSTAPNRVAVWRNSFRARPKHVSANSSKPGLRRTLVTTAAAAGTRTAPGSRTAGRNAASFILHDGTVDYYELLGVDDIATPEEVKMAYRALAKVCHVDVVGDTEANREMCILLNEAYEVLMDPEQRHAYNADLDRALQDEDDGYTGEPLSKWMANTKMGKNTNPEESRAVFVDEVSCIGCKQCVWVAPATFRMEDLYGRSRVFGQWLDSEDDIQAAMDACPVSCIHWVDRADLPPLEFVVRNKVGRTNVAAMMAQQGQVDDVWAAAAQYLKERRRREEDRAAAARYSARQEAARRAAAQNIMQRQSGWFSTFASRFGISNMAAAAATAMDEVVNGYTSSDDEYSSYQKVGRRRRSRRKVQGAYGARGSRGGKVPDDRALVPVGAVLRPWKRDVAP